MPRNNLIPPHPQIQISEDFVLGRRPARMPYLYLVTGPLKASRPGLPQPSYTATTAVSYFPAGPCIYRKDW